MQKEIKFEDKNYSCEIKAADKETLKVELKTVFQVSRELSIWKIYALKFQH